MNLITRSKFPLRIRFLTIKVTHITLNNIKVNNLMLSKLFFSVAALVPSIVIARGKNDGSGRHDAVTDELINNDKFIV